MAPLRVSVSAILVVMTGAACGGGGGGTQPGPTATQIAKNGGDNQVAPAGSALTPLSVIVRDANNNPVQGVSVNWATSGGGTVSAASSVSDAAGIAAITRTLGVNAGPQATTATKSGLAGSPLTFNAVAQIQGATQMSLNAGSGQADTVLATLGTPLSVLVRDQNLTPVAGVVVNWTAPNDTVSAATSTSNGSGIASITLKHGPTAGTRNAQATVTGLMNSPVNFSHTANAGAAFEIVKLPGSGDGGSAAINTMVTYTVTARDSHNNPKSGVTIDWTATGGGGSITPAQNTTGGNGTASASRTLSGTGGAHTATATANGIPGTPSVTFTTTATTAPLAASVTVSNNIFTPNAVTIAVTGTVTWTWAAGAVTHNVTFAPAAGVPGNITNTNSGSFPRQFNSTGTFNYECTIHGPPMTGTVTVQ